MRRNHSLYVLIALFVGLTSFMSTEKEIVNIEEAAKWVVLGSRTVNLGADHDEIPVTLTGESFKRLKFKVLNAPIYIHSLEIIYGNGNSEKHKINQYFKEGLTSKALDLTGGNRIIKKIVFNYGTVGASKGRAHIVAMGRH